MTDVVVFCMKLSDYYFQTPEVIQMESMQVESPFKSPRFKSLPLRSRLGSGSSASSTERDSPNRKPTTQSSGSVTLSSNNGIVDENEDPHDSDPSSSSGDRVNPFEKDILAGLQKSFWSPSIMEIKETPPQRTWAIEHLSHLFPKDIENSPSTHQNAFPVDAQTEAKAQADIDAYFNRGPIVPTPSPMKEARQVQNERIGKTNILYGGHCGQSPVGRGGVLSLTSGNLMKKTIIKKLPTTTTTDRWTQTMLSFPEQLPQHIQDVLSKYYTEENLCGSSDEVSDSLSQKMEISEQDCGDNNDSGKNSSYLNNSIRRRLDLSFGEDPDGECSNGVPSGESLSPIRVPFMCNHVVSTPPDSSIRTLNTTTTELELQFMRCEFTPESRGVSKAMSPGITPIQNDTDEDHQSSDNCSTPRRANNPNPRRVMKSFVFQMSVSNCTGDTGMSSTESSNMNTQNLRRCRPESPHRIRATKTASAYSFDDSQLLTGSSPKPAKLLRSKSENDAS